MESDEFSIINWLNFTFIPYSELCGVDRPEDLSVWRKMSKDDMEFVINRRIEIYEELAKNVLSEL